MRVPEELVAFIAFSKSSFYLPAYEISRSCRTASRFKPNGFKSSLPVAVVLRRCACWMCLSLGCWRRSGEGLASGTAVAKAYLLRWNAFSRAHCKDTIPNIQNKYSQERNCAATVPISTFMFLWAIIIFLWSACLFCCRKIGGPNVGIDRSLTDTCWTIWLEVLVEVDLPQVALQLLGVLGVYSIITCTLCAEG